MLKPRIIPCLTMDENYDCVNTIKFRERRYIGDILNTVKIFNEKNVDEIIILDIDSTIKNKTPNFNLIEKLASVCRMPLCYGGGIKSPEDAIKILKLGVEKISLGNAAIEDVELIKKITKEVGSQSVAVCIDIKKNKKNNSFEIFTNNGKKLIDKKLDNLLFEIQDKGVGEIIFNSIDRDGTMNGFYLEILEKHLSKISTPTTIIGGAGNYEDIRNLCKKYKIIGAGCTSIFVYKGIHKAVLINYPSPNDKQKIFCKD